MDFHPLGDAAVRVGLGSGISAELNRKVRAYCLCLERDPIPGVTECVPTYAAVTVFYRPHAIRYADLCRSLDAAAKRAGKIKLPRGEILVLPTAYGGKHGPDLSFVAKHSGISEDEVVAIHGGGTYPIYMMGFMPGFPYLGGLSPRIATPRLETPRVSVPAGSVGIAGDQTGVYPLASPGGWRLIGRTPVRLYDPAAARPILLDAGNCVRFRSIGEDEYDRIEEQAKRGAYEVERQPGESAWT